VTSGLEVVATGPLTTVQDIGRLGWAALGVGRSGAADRASLRLANRLLANPDDAAALEVTAGGLVVRAVGPQLVAVTGAVGTLAVAGRVVSLNELLPLDDGDELRVGPPVAGLRSYVGVRGGVAVAAVLGSRATDSLSGLGPPGPVVGDVLPVGSAPRDFPVVDAAAVVPPTTDEVTLRVVLGPRDDWFTQEAVDALLSTPYTVTADSNRVGMRLAGEALTRQRDDELPSEGVVPGALQVPPTGQPVLFLADHPVTGGYPVVAVVMEDDVDRAAQVGPGRVLRFTAGQGHL
jgi:biotin-dependent carboxylase-like uncharacterized protein